MVLADGGCQTEEEGGFVGERCALAGVVAWEDAVPEEGEQVHGLADGIGGISVRAPWGGLEEAGGEFVQAEASVVDVVVLYSKISVGVEEPGGGGDSVEIFVNGGWVA
jgi:hypothetical protein